MEKMRFETSITDILERTYNVKSFRFSRPESFTYKPGQFIFITIRTDNGQLKKHFTISSSPTETDYIEFTKKLTGHPFSNALNAIKVGNWTMIDGPYGDFSFEGEQPKVGMLSGGIGITPLRSICKYCTDKNLDSKITLLYGNRTEEDIVFRKELEELQQENKNLLVVHTLTNPSSDWLGSVGMINEKLIKEEIPDYNERVFLVVGPPAMVRNLSKLLSNLGLPPENIKKENFPGY